MKPDRSIRLSQGITTFGVGAIVGIGEESFINKDIFKWIANDQQKVSIDLPRLAQRLRVQEFKHPRPKEYNKRGGKFSFMRFPRMLFCPSCRSMFEMSYSMANELNGEVPTCMNHKCKSKGRKKLLPMRFVVVCENGHIDDFPWWRWAHSKSDRASSGNCQVYDQLEFRTKSSVGASYAALEVRCKSCGSRRDLGGLENKDALREIGFKCRGKQPWQSTESASDCDEVPQMKQRNASNIFQPVIVSAIDIPIGIYNTNESENTDLLVRIRSHQYFTTCEGIYRSNNERNAAVDSIVSAISQDCNCSNDDVYVVLEGGMIVAEEDVKIETTFDLKQLLKTEEWSIFFQDFNEKKFVNQVERLHSRLGDLVEEKLISFIDHVSLVKRLREVRAYKGFNRIKFDPGKIITASLGRNTSWLPAVEVYGEGIFISIDKVKLDTWYDTNKNILDERFKKVNDRYEQKEMAEQSGPFSPKFIMLHTLSHLLVRQLAFESGYNSSSLRENIYFSDDIDNPMAGILIYTADSDSEGSLGGLVRQGESDRLLPTIITALQRALWCSADPVCRESDGQGLDGLNKAACHACTLISETSCAYFNALLDRSLLIDEEIGFFREVYKNIEDGS